MNLVIFYRCHIQGGTLFPPFQDRVLQLKREIGRIDMGDTFEEFELWLNFYPCVYWSNLNEGLEKIKPVLTKNSPFIRVLRRFKKILAYVYMPELAYWHKLHIQNTPPILADEGIYDTDNQNPPVLSEEEIFVQIKKKILKVLDMVEKRLRPEDDLDIAAMKKFFAVTTT